MDSQDSAPRFEVLLITNSAYEDESGFAPLPFVKTDVGIFRQFLEHSDVLTAKNKTLSHDDSKEEFDDKWGLFQAKVLAASKDGPVVAIVYYSGHGCIAPDDPREGTRIVHVAGESSTPIEDKLCRLGKQPNVQVFAILDCCRQKIAQKGKMNYAAEPLSPALFIGFGCRKWATSSQRGDGDSASRYTKDVVAFCESRATLDLPGDLMVAPFMSYADQRAEKCTRNFRLGTGGASTAGSSSKKTDKIEWDGGEYEGEMNSDGEPHGHGSLTKSDSKYDGAWRNGEKHGQGELTCADGQHYKGQYKDGKPHGQGTFTYANGKYAGAWRNGQRDGQGETTCTSGQHYKGQYKDDDKHGQGTYTWPSGAKYVGQYKNGEQHGHGTYTYADGGKYDGQWLNGMEHGHGTYTGADGHIFEGQYKDGQKHGQGTLAGADGKLEAQFRDGELVRWLD